VIDSVDSLPRPRYFQRIAPYIGTSLVKVIVGQRRVGKSWFLRQLAAHLAQKRPGVPLVFIEKELASWDSVRSGADLLRTVHRAAARGPAIVLVDEVQEISDFARALRSLAAERRFDLYVTGSNAELLSGEIATLFAGRSIQLAVHPLTYDEFLVFHCLPDEDETLARYLRYGGLPFLRNLPLRDDTAYEYLRGVYDTTVLKDVVARHGLRAPDLLDRLALFLADNVGSPTSARSIVRFLASQRVKVSVPTVLDYLVKLRDAIVVDRVRRSDLRGKRIFEIGEKYYFEDLGLRAAVRGFRDEDIGKVVENAVFLRLIADGWKVTSGALGDREVDFVAEQGDQRLYVQAAYLVADAATRKREFGNLLAIDDNFPKLVVSLDPVVADSNGVRHLRLRDFARDGWPTHAP
jgi:predicted AAA+ superfamily ATPase